MTFIFELSFQLLENNYTVSMHPYGQLLQQVNMSYNHLAASTLSGCASVLKIHSSKGKRSGDENVSQAYFNVSASQKVC